MFYSKADIQDFEYLSDTHRHKYKEVTILRWYACGGREKSLLVRVESTPPPAVSLNIILFAILMKYILYSYCIFALAFVLTRYKN